MLLGISDVVSFFLGSIITLFICHIYFNKKIFVIHRQNAELNAQVISQNLMREIIKEDFVKLANETINKEQEDLRKQSRETLEEKIKPLSQKLNEFQEKIEKYNISGVENTIKIIEQINLLEKNNKIIEQEAKKLVDALTNDKNVKGMYGENLLDVVLQTAGLEEGLHYQKQFVTTSVNLSDGVEHTIRPDVVINLPNNQNIIIDSKVTLSSYLEYRNDDTHIKEFKSEIKKRITELSNKDYRNAKGLEQPDFVLMYIPVEPCVNIIYSDYEIINYAYKSNIIIVGTSSLLTTLRLVGQLFSSQKQNENVKQIIQAGTNLYETFVQFCEDLIDLQKRFDGVNSQFNKTINRFRRNNPNKPSLFSQVEELKTYGLSSNKQIPENLLEEEIEKEGMFVND